MCKRQAIETKKLETMDKRPRKHAKTTTSGTSSSSSQEVNSIDWESLKMTEQEEDLINRMYRLVGDRWDLIAGRVSGRKPEEIERFWIMRHGNSTFPDKRSHQNARNS